MKMGDAGSTVRLGVIGLGGRGCGQMKTLLSMPDVEIPAVCDVYADRAEKGARNRARSARIRARTLLRIFIRFWNAAIWTL